MSKNQMSDGNLDKFISFENFDFSYSYPPKIKIRDILF